MAHWEHDDGLRDPVLDWDDELDPDEEYDRHINNQLEVW